MTEAFDSYVNNTDDFEKNLVFGTIVVALIVCTISPTMAGAVVAISVVWFLGRRLTLQADAAIKPYEEKLYIEKLESMVHSV